MNKFPPKTKFLKAFNVELSWQDVYLFKDKGDVTPDMATFIINYILNLEWVEKGTKAYYVGIADTIEEGFILIL